MAATLSWESRHFLFFLLYHPQDRAFIPWSQMAFAALTSVATCGSHMIGQILKYMAKHNSKSSWKMSSLSGQICAQLTVESFITEERKNNIREELASLTKVARTWEKVMHIYK